MLGFVTASRAAPSVFLAESWLARSVGARHPIAATCENARGLPEVYNAAIDAAAPDDVIVFAHDDLWIADRHFELRLRRALLRFDVVGVAGNRERTPGQSSWISSDGLSNDAPERLSGRVAHPAPAGYQIDVYGPTPCEVKLLDGVLLAASAGVLQRACVRFDPRFAFHFYDLDFCRTCEAAGLKLGTWPLGVAHRSAGGFRTLAWCAARQAYFAKWEN